MTGRTLALGIDPGLSGALALLAERMPTIGSGAQHVVDGAALARMIEPHMLAIRLALIEQVSARPNQGVSSAFRFGHATGTIMGVIGALEIPHRLISPATWKRRLGLSADKEQCRARAVQLFPSVPLARKRDHDLAEALLLAHVALADVSHAKPERLAS